MPPTIADYLPDFNRFLHELTTKVQSNEISTWQQFEQPCLDFYTPDAMAKIEPIVPDWQEMASYRDSITLFHVTSVFVALFKSEEYQTLNERQQALVEWAVLFHDVAKVPPKIGHDYVHGFKSAGIAGKALAQLDFPIKEGITQQKIDTWFDLTYNATIYSQEHAEHIQDTSKFPAIIDSLQAIHSEDAYAIVMAVLLHIAIDSDPRYPILAPMSEAHIKQYITTDAEPIIRNLILADGSGWELFSEDKTIDQERRLSVHRVFDNIVALISP